MKNKLIKTTNKEINNLDKDLTFKQKAWLKYYFESGNATQAALKAYETDDPGSASVIGTENLAKLRNPIKAYMENKGLSLGRLVEVLDDGLKANRVISAVNTDKQASGASSDFIEVPDHQTRHKYLETASKWLGVVEEKQDVVAIQNNITLSDDQINRLMEEERGR